MASLPLRRSFPSSAGSSAPEYSPTLNGNVFDWVLEQAMRVRKAQTPAEPTKLRLYRKV